MVKLTDTRVAALKPPRVGQAEYPDDLVTGLRLRMGAGGRKSWIVRTRVGTKVLNKTLGSYPTLGVGKAREEARKFLEDLATTGTPRANRTFGQLAEDWLDKVAKPNNRSWQLQKRRLEIHVLPKWGDRKLDTIRRADVRELIESIEGEVSPNRNLTLVRTLLRYAVSRDWIESSPADFERVAQRQDPTRLLKRAQQDVALKPEIARVFAENFAIYGVRKVWRQMLREGFKAQLHRDPELVARFDILASIPGIGALTAITMLVEMPELGSLNSKQAVSLAGLAPQAHDSGQHRGRRHIRGGRAILRHALYMTAPWLLASTST